MKLLVSLKKLFPYLKPHLNHIIVSGMLAVPLAGLRAAPVPLVKEFVDDLLINKDPSKLFLLPIALVSIYTVNFPIRFGHYYLLRIVVAQTNKRIRYHLYNHLLNLSSDYFTKNSTGNLISRIASDPQHVDGGIGSINVLIREPITFTFLFISAIYLNWKLTLIVLLIIPFLAWVFSATGRNLKRYTTRLTEENAGIFSNLQETVTGNKIIKTFGLETYVKNKFEQRIENFKKFVLKTSALEEASHPMVELLTGIALASVVFFGGKQVLQGTMTGGELIAFFTAFGLMMDPIRRLNDVNMRLHSAAAATDRIFDVMSWKSSVLEPDSPSQWNSFEKSILLEKVSFSYPDSSERKVLKEVSFTIPKGQITALIGESGSGKSSVTNLVTRIYDASSGKILVDGTNIKNIKTSELRKHIAVVSQDVFLFNDTIEENIRCGRLNATSQEIEEASKQAFAYDFIQALPEGFHTVIGDRGQKLSGGERQRISIARAFLRNASILILDEATSSLDAASEKAVQNAIDNLMKDRTSLVIAHRLSTIENADNIVVLKEGLVIESGRHSELMKKNGAYAHLRKLSQTSLS